MVNLQSISDVPKDEITKLINSIDYVFFDIDGVLIHDKTCIPGSQEGVSKFQQLGKKIAYVSNNTLYQKRLIAENLKPFNVTEDQIVVPNDALLTYLKKIDFKKDIYVLSFSLPKKQLKEAGYNVIEYKDICSHELEENINEVKELSLHVLEVCKNVGAVFVDLDFNYCFGSIQAVKIILNHKKDVIFLTGLNDDLAPMSAEMNLIASKFYIDGIERWTKKKATTMAKPGLPLKDELNLRFNVSDDSRVLFIGDNPATDIAFGVACGYKTCLVLSGVTTKSQIEEWKFPENFKPTYVAESLGVIYEKIKDL